MGRFHSPDEQVREGTIVNRRSFLARTACTAAAALTSSLLADSPKPPAMRENGAAKPRPSSRPRVVNLRSSRVLSGRSVQAPLLRSCLEIGLCALTGRQSAADAWHVFLEPDDVILLKFNQSGSGAIGTSNVMAEELVKSLERGGWSPEQIILLEVSGPEALLRRTRRPDFRWQQREIEFGSAGRDSFLAVLEDATAIINVPFLKTHHMATMSGCLKNLSHGLIRHPARFHENGCDPAIGQIVASAPIRSRLRLNLTNALRVVFDRGPDARAEDLHDAGAMLFSVDPVACDAVGFGILNEIRSVRRLPPLLPNAQVARQLVTASGLGLGQADIEAVELVNVAV